MVVWIVGLSGAGKSTVGRAFYKNIKSNNPATVLVDGDEIRSVFKHDQHESAYSIEGRRINAERIQSLCLWLDKQGIDVVCCILSVFPEIHEKNLNIFSSYREVFIDVCIERLIEQDNKGLYQTALKGEQINVVGVDIPYCPPCNPDLVIKNSQKLEDIESYVQKIISICH